MQKLFFLKEIPNSAFLEDSVIILPSTWQNYDVHSRAEHELRGTPQSTGGFTSN